MCGTCEHCEACVLSGAMARRIMSGGKMVFTNSVIFE